MRLNTILQQYGNLRIDDTSSGIEDEDEYANYDKQYHATDNIDDVLLGGTEESGC